MSIETNPSLTDSEVNNRIGHLEHQLARGEEVASVVDEITVKYVPHSLTEAEGIIEGLTNYNRTLQADIAKHPGLKEEIGEDYVSDLQDTTAKGIDNWRLDKTERSMWAEVAGTTHAKRLSPRMRSLMHTLSPEDAHETETQKFARLTKQAHGRLVLDDAIASKYGDTTPSNELHAAKEVAPQDTQTYEERTYANGTKHFYATGKDGKKHHVSAASILTAYDHDGDFQGKRPRVNTVVAETPKDNGPAKPDYVSQEEWDGYDNVQKLISINPKVAERRKSTQNLPMPASYRDPEAWNKKTDAEKQRLIAVAEMIKTDDAKRVVEQLPPRKREAVKNLGHLIAAKAVTGMSSMGEYYSDAEKGKRRKLTLLAGIVALAGAGIAYLAAKNGMSAPNGGHAAELVQHKSQDAATKHTAVAEIHNSLSPAAEKVQTVKLHAGDTIWNESKEHLINLGNRHPSRAQITEEMHHVMQLNHIDEDEARHLAVGTKIKF